MSGTPYNGAERERQAFIQAIPRNILTFFIIVPVILFFVIRYLWGRGGHLLFAFMTWGTIGGVIIGIVYALLMVGMALTIRDRLREFDERTGRRPVKRTGRSTLIG